ncbi:MAG TPA: alpha/beta hydrolase [Pseudomonas xinjiangensis]|uniref:Alpha/beta hydrolase n=2 Tax=root TaxID=1 RepID=A0A7V1BN25_9GAMM|nr:alpha/beta hydrolase [Halopseudomonas xinjiangensis]HEC48026.1 alpha/beta hydrolase [Halopseudomonas xinjiangensis]
MNALKKSALLGLTISAITLSGCFDGGSSSDDDDVAPVAEEPTAQQQRIDDGFFVVDEAALEFDALNAAVPAYAGTSRWTGVINGAGYRVEVPENWNGMLVMYAHGFRGEGPNLTVDSPPMRQYLLDEGYAWAASSYSANFYDVRAGVEDTNALALAFNDIATENGRTLAAPTKRYITGVSMGGHVAGAAIELEAQQTADNFVPYDGAAPMCGVMGDTELFDYFTAYGLALYELAGVGADSFPVSEADAAEKVATAREVLWVDYDTNKAANGLTAQGFPLLNIVRNLTGGERPIYNLSFGGFQDLLQGFAGADGTITGILNDSVVDTTDVTYRLQTQNGQPLTAAETQFNQNIAQATPVSGANALREDGLRWIPKVNGELYADIPVVTVHTLGDLFVPISMQQIYRERMETNGFGDNLVQRAVRAPGHCDFSLAEFTNTLDAMLDWEQTGVKPAGDDLLDPALVADENFGCQFTVNGPPQTLTRTFMPACTL